MKKLVAMGCAVFAAVAAFGEMSLADARAKIVDIVGNASEMSSVMKELASSNQVAFLSEVNAAIADLPGSSDEKAKKFLDVNEAAMRERKGNLAALMAETYATVPPEALTVINERFASDLINRDADPANKVTDAEFVNLAKSTMSAIQSRNASSDNAGVRDTFAILMFLRASNGSPADLRDTLVAGLPDAETRDLAQNEWIGPALEGDYDPILGAADAGAAPEIINTLRQSGPNVLPAMLGDLSGVKGLEASTFNTDQYGRPNLAEDYGIDRRPLSLDKKDPWYSAGKRGEPSGYDHQDENAY